MRREEALKPTRLNLLRARRKLSRVRRGTDLLRRKREALVRALLDHAAAAVEDRERIERAADVAYPALVRALGEQGASALMVSAEPLRDATVTVETADVWGVPVAVLRDKPAFERSLEARATAPAATPSAVVEAAEAFERLVDLLLEATPREQLLRRLAEAVSRVSRQVRALELRVEPSVRSAIRRIGGLLDEREREEHARLRRFLRNRARGPVGRRSRP